MKNTEIQARVSLFTWRQVGTTVHDPVHNLVCGKIEYRLRETQCREVTLQIHDNIHIKMMEALLRDENTKRDT